MEFIFEDNQPVVVTNDLIIRTFLMEGLGIALRNNKTYEDFIAAGDIFEKNAQRVARIGNFDQEKMFLWDALGCYVHARRFDNSGIADPSSQKTGALIREVMEKIKINGVPEVLMTPEKFGGHTLVYAALLRS